MIVKNNNKQIVMEATTKEKRAYISGDNKYNIVYSVRLETTKNYNGIKITGCRMFNDSILIDSGLECKRKVQKQLDKITSELTIYNFKSAIEYLKQNIIKMSHDKLDEEDQENIKFIDSILNNNNLEGIIEY